MKKAILLFFASLIWMSHVSANQAGEAFIQNRGQWPSAVVAAWVTHSGTMYIERNGLRFIMYDPSAAEEMHHTKQFTGVFKRQCVTATWLNSSGNPQIEFSGERLEKFNYFIGNDQRKWASNVPAFEELMLKDVYPGINVRFYFKNHDFKYDFELSHAADFKRIQIKYEGAEKLIAEKNGSISIDCRFLKLQEKAPVSFQAEHKIKTSFVLKNNILSFNLKPRNLSSPLTIDPVLVFSTFTGSYGDNWGFTATYDNKGFTYAGGIALQTGYRITPGAFDTTFNGTGYGVHDITLTKFDTLGRTMLYSTYLGGQGMDEPMSLVCDTFGNLVVYGHTTSTDYPVTANAYDTSYNGSYDLVITKLDSNGAALIGSTYFGGIADDGYNSPTNNYVNRSNTLNYNYGDFCRGDVVLDGFGNIFIAGNTKSANFPTFSVGGTPIQSTLGGAQDAILASFTPNLSALRFSTFLGGSFDDAAYSVILDNAGNVLVAGGTKSPDFGTFTSGSQPSYTDSIDGFCLKINPFGTAIVNGTYVGSSGYDQVFFLQKDQLGNIYVLGQTEGNWNPTPGKYSVANGRQFIIRYNSTLTARNLISTFGTANAPGPQISPTAFLVDVCGRIYVAGWGGSVNRIFGQNQALGFTTGLPVTPDALKDSTDGSDYYLMVLERNADSLLYATFIGGGVSSEHVDGGTCRFDPMGIVYHVACAGCGGHSDFPTTPGAFSATNNSTNCNLAAFKFDFQLVKIVANYVIINSNKFEGCLGDSVFFKCITPRPDQILWDFDDRGITSTALNPFHIFPVAKTYNVKLIVRNCNSADTLIKQVVINPPPRVTLTAPSSVCYGKSIQLLASGGITYSWTGDTSLSSLIISNPIATPTQSGFYKVTIIDSNGCTNQDSAFVTVFKSLNPILQTDTSICAGGDLQLWGNIDTAVIANWTWLDSIGNTIGTNNFPLYSTPFPGKVYLKYVTKDGCELFDSLNIHWIFSFKTVASPDQVVCKGNPTILSASGATTYQWSTGQTGNSITVVQSDSIKWYYVTGSIGRCKGTTDSILVSTVSVMASFVPEPDSGYAPLKVDFKNTSVGNISNYTWNFGDGTSISSISNPTHIYQNAGIYTPKLVITSSNPTCIDTFSYRYIVVDSVFLVIPNAFTPNGDGLNEEIRYSGYSIAEIEVEIYNRWGERVFQGKGPEVVWNGTYKGEIVEQGAYAYIIKAKGKNGNSYAFEGILSVLR